jgi:hypothetical protein
MVSFRCDAMSAACISQFREEVWGVYSLCNPLPREYNKVAVGDCKGEVAQVCRVDGSTLDRRKLHLAKKLYDKYPTIVGMLSRRRYALVASRRED